MAGMIDFPAQDVLVYVAVSKNARVDERRPTLKGGGGARCGLVTESN